MILQTTTEKMMTKTGANMCIGTPNYSHTKGN